MNKSMISNYSEESFGRSGELFPYSTLIFSSVTLVACIFGAFGNALSFLIYNSRSMRGSSINSLLAGLSAVDFALTILAILVFVLPGFNYYLHDPVLTTFYIVVACSLYQCVLITQTCSCWTFVLISIERYIAVCHPLKVKLILTVTRARYAQVAVVFAAVLYNCIRFFEFEADPAGEGVRKLLLQSRTYFVSYYVCLYLLTHCFGPFVIIFVLNVLILRAIRRSGSTKRKEGTTMRKSQKQTQQGKITRMIIVVTSAFAISNTLPYVINIWEAASPDLFDNEDRWTLLASFILDASNTLLVLNSSITCLVYLCYCRKYKLLFLDYCLTLIRCRRSRSAYTRRFTSFDSYFSTVDLYDYYMASGIGSSIGCRSVRSHSDTTTTYPAHKEHFLGFLDNARRPVARRAYYGYYRKTGAYGLQYELDRKSAPRHSLQVPLPGKGSIVSAHILFNGSIRAAIFASRKSV